jgi:predicted CXXCH cytochrome family protein
MLLSAPAEQLCFRCHPKARAWAAAPSAHGPVRSGDCSECHDPHAAGPALLAKQGAALCARCHDVQAAEERRGPAGHAPVVKGDCAACHVPHGSPDAPLLSGRPEKLCVRCHEGMYASRQDAKLHRPFAGGRCTACHVGHGGAPHLVRPQDPCRSCHTAAERRWDDARSRHAPVAQGRCTACHDPHSSGAPRLLRKTGRELCLGCHDALAKRLAAKGAVVHAPVAEGDCGTCHDPHAAAEGPLLDRAVPALCAGCHDVQQKTFASAHAPYDARTARCTGCHDPHVSARPGLVADVLHQPFADRDCQTCHVRTPDGAPQVVPAVGKVCLECHDLAPSKHDPVRKGRCSACHSPHASSRPHLAIASGAALCDRCHDRGRPRWKKLHADAGAEGMDCVDCHEAHPKK